jgi:hypothetical protein
MTYSKPEISILGKAAKVIESMDQKPQGSIDAVTGSTQNPGPAYDLDE